MTRHDPDRGAAVLSCIVDYQATYGYPPSVREIARRVGLASTSAVHHHLRKLQQAGLISTEYGIARAISVTRPDGACPFCGHVEVPA